MGKPDLGPVSVHVTLFFAPPLTRPAVQAGIVALGVASSPVCHLSCNGHGSCDTTTKQCTCYKGWGAPEDVAV